MSTTPETEGVGTPTPSMATVLDAARKWRDEIENEIIPGCDPEDEAGYTAQADAISAALDALQPINIYLTGDEDGPDMFGVIYDTEDDATESAFENDLYVWRVPVQPLLERAERIERDSDD